jgi:hypothetical protein
LRPGVPLGRPAGSRTGAAMSMTVQSGSLDGAPRDWLETVPVPAPPAL